MFIKIIDRPVSKIAGIAGGITGALSRHHRQKNYKNGFNLYLKILPTLIIFFILMTTTFLFFPGVFETEAEAFSISARGTGFFTTFADTGVLQNEEIQLDEDIFDDSLAFDITSAPGFTLGAAVETRPGVQFTIDAGLFSTSDSAKTEGEGGIEARVDASLLLPSLQLAGEFNVAEFAEMYDIPSVIFFGGAGYYHGLGEIIFENIPGKNDRDLSGGGIGFKAGSRLALELSERLAVHGTLCYRQLEIKFDEHTDLSGPEIGAGITFTF